MAKSELIKAVLSLTPDHEGRRAFLYKCSEGFWTIGIGHNLEAGPLPDEIIDRLFEIDLENALKVCESLPYFSRLSTPRQAALIDMAFQMGTRLKAFRQMHMHLEAGDFPAARLAALNSRWARQTPKRANRIATIIETGVIV